DKPRSRDRNAPSPTRPLAARPDDDRRLLRQPWSARELGLQRDVIDAKALVQHRLRSLEDRGPIVEALDIEMRRKCRALAADAPDMQIVNGRDTAERSERIADLVQIYGGRDAFHE